MIKKLPKKVINIIKPSQKYIPPFHPNHLQKHKIIDRVNNKQYHYVPEFHFDTIKQILSKPLYQLCTENDSIKNHFSSNNSALSVINYLLMNININKM